MSTSLRATRCNLWTSGATSKLPSENEVLCLRLILNSYVSEYILEGHRVVYHNVVLLLHRILRFPSDTEHPSEPSDHLYSLQDFTPVDLSGSYALQASVRLQDGNKPESIFVGLKELKELQEMMEGVVDLKPGDRLALDTRSKN